MEFVSHLTVAFVHSRRPTRVERAAEATINMGSKVWGSAVGGSAVWGSAVWGSAVGGTAVCGARLCVGRGCVWSTGR